MRSKLYLIAVIISLTASGCMSTAVTGANAVYNRQNIQNMTSQYQIAKHIRDVIQVRAPHAVEISRIRVIQHNYMILLLGDVPDEATKQLIENEIVAYVNPQPVYSHLEISQGEKKNQSNPWINTKIRSQFISNKKINPRSIKVIVDDHVAYLIGNVTKEQAELAANIASHTKGVERVITYFQIIKHDLSLNTRVSPTEEI